MKNYNLILCDGTRVTKELEEKDILKGGYLSEAKAFDIFFDSMILNNDYEKLLYTNDIKYLVDGRDYGYDSIEEYADEDNYDYIDEYQFFIVNFTCTEELIIEAVKSMGNTLYYDLDNDLYLMGVTDLGTSRTLVSTNIKCEEIKD